MSTVKFSKRIDALPTTLTPNTLYFIKKGNRVQTYMSDSQGTEALPVGGSSEQSIEPFLLMGVGHV